MSLAERLRNLRATRKAKLEEVAKIINVSREDYYAIEKGLVTAGSDQLASLAKFYGVKSINS